MYIYIYTYTHTYIGWHYLSHATCLIRPRVFCAVFPDRPVFGAPRPSPVGLRRLDGEGHYDYYL